MTVPVDSLMMSHQFPMTIEVVGSLQIWVVVPVNFWNCGEEIVRVVVPAAVAVLVSPDMVPAGIALVVALIAVVQLSTSEPWMMLPSA